MKANCKIVLLWILSCLLIGADRVIYAEFEGISKADGLVYCSSALLGIVSFYLWKKELRLGTRCVFGNISLWFLGNAILSPVFELCRHSLSWLDPWCRIWFYQYYLLLYFFLLFVCVLFLVIDQFLANRRLLEKYAIVLIASGILWTIVAYPYVSDPKVLAKEPAYLDYVAIRLTLDHLKSTGNASPAMSEIASSIALDKRTVNMPLAALGKDKREQRIAEILPYIPDINGVLLLYEPLWTRCALIALACAILLVGLSVWQYVVDMHVSAYLEKIAWCLLLFCICEALHFYLYTKASDSGLQHIMEVIGQYLSTSIIFIISILCLIRLHFIDTVEGKFYERWLMNDPSRITRWRDSFDNWILRQFMDPGELDRRFLMQRRNRE
jgi:hypothetical protein